MAAKKAMAAASWAAKKLVQESKLRGQPVEDLVEAFAMAMASRDATLAGEVIFAVEEALAGLPIKQILTIDGEVAK